MPKITEARREDRRRQILDAALVCFAENGFHQTSMPDIVRRSGLSHGAVYVYFKSKDDIIVALAVDRHRQEAVLNSAALASGDALESLRALVRGYARSLSEPGGDARRRVSVNGWAEALRNDRVRASVLEGVETPVSVIAALVERAQAQGAMSANIDPEAVGRSLVALFQGFALQVAWGEAVDMQAAVAVVERMLSGLASQGDVTAARKPRAR